MYIRSTKRKQQALETKSRVFDTAHRMFRDRGFYNVTVEEIAQEAGISVGTIYHLFKNKYDLLFAWHFKLDEKYKEYYEELKKDPKYQEAGTLELLREWFLAVHEICADFGMEYISVIYAYMLSDKDFARTMTDRERTYFKIILELVEKGQSEGSITKRMAAEQIASDFTVLSRGLFSAWAINNSKLSMREFCKSPLDIFIRGVSTAYENKKLN